MIDRSIGEHRIFVKSSQLSASQSATYQTVKQWRDKHGIDYILNPMGADEYCLVFKDEESMTKFIMKM